MGSALAGLAGVFIAPIIYLDPAGLVLLIIPAVSTALIGEFASFPVTFCVALALGIANSEITRYVSAPGWASAAPFVAIVAVLVVRGRGLPLRSFVSERLPAVGSGRVNPVAVALLYIGGSALILSLDQTWASPLTATFATAIICLSVVVVTGYAGQLSLAQAVLAGVGALVAARLDSHLPFTAAVLLAMIVTAAAGSVLGLPALRTRGITLAIVTLGLGGAVASVLFDNLNWAGGSSGVPVSVPTIFGWDIDPFLKANRYGFVVFSLLSLAALGVANLRRGRVGRRLLAIRSNERAAAALGVNVAGVKLYAFAVAAALASLGGTLLAFQQPSVVTNGNASYSVLACILIVGAVVVAGVGTPGGAIFGSLLLAGGIISKIFDTVASIDNYLPLAGGILLILTLILSPDGIVEVNRLLVRRALAPVGAYWRGSSLAARLMRPSERFQTDDGPVRADSGPLRVEGLCVAFGGVQAVQQVTLEVRPGQVHGIIGPNGAGKTTLIDAMTGFVRATSGSVWLGGAEITGWGVRRRARAGLSRSFQSLELFDDLTVLENLAVASDRARAGRYLTDLIWPGRIRLNAAAAEALAQFELGDIADQKPANVSFGRRKTVAIARAVASNPSVLLLDEPAAGLDDHEADELARLIRMLADEWGIGILLVEHKTEMIMTISDHVTVLDGGRLLTSGRPESVGNDPKVHAAYLGVP
jgi:sulfate-transporting ATPase